MTAAEVIRILLVIDLLALLALCGFYLRTRRLPPAGYLFYGLLALVIPILGPFLVIALRPGEPRVRSPRSARVRQRRFRKPAANRSYASEVPWQVDDRE
jgi:hypothetical protein